MKFGFSGLKAGLVTAAAAGTLAACVVVEDGPRPLPPGPGPGGQVMCTMQYDPVCGERRGQRETLGNACVARAEGFRIIHPGECRRGGPGWDRPGRPGAVRPQACTREYRPVCAVRGNRQQSFANACEAEAAGWRIRRSGQC